MLIIRRSSIWLIFQVFILVQLFGFIKPLPQQIFIPGLNPESQKSNYEAQDTDHNYNNEYDYNEEDVFAYESETEIVDKNENDSDQLMTTTTSQSFSDLKYNINENSEVESNEIDVKNFYVNSNTEPEKNLKNSWNTAKKIDYASINNAIDLSKPVDIPSSNKIVTDKSNKKEIIKTNECLHSETKKFPDIRICNMYNLCQNGVIQMLLCPEGYLYSENSQQCEEIYKVNCGSRIILGFDNTVGEAQNSRKNLNIKIKVINGSLECPLGFDGYYDDPEFCNVYHHCLAGVDYAEQCPTQLVWNDHKKMCDWPNNVNCSGKLIPIAHGQKSFCSEKLDGKYKDPEYCNIFHHCISGYDNVIRCDNELVWNEKEGRCDRKNKVRCYGKMLASNKRNSNSTFCRNKPDGSYPHQEYCNVYHVCEAGHDNIRQCPNQLFWDAKNKRCDWSGKVECAGRTLVTLSTESTLFCIERKDGVYGDPLWCNIYHTCLSGVDYRTKCPENLIWNEVKKGCDWSDSIKCSTGKLYKDSKDVLRTFCSDRQNGKYNHDLYCNQYYVCQNGKDSVFTCQNNLRYNDKKQECDWAVNVDCNSKQDYMWEGIKESFCKSKPDGNYADPIYCNIFHQCQAAMDYPKKCSNRLMFNATKGECDWEDQVDCRGKEKLIETVGLENESKAENINDKKGRVTKFCMTKSNGNYGDLHYCNIYHNCHGGYDTVQHCANGLVWRQETNTSGTCDWPLTSNIANGVDCGSKQIFFISKNSKLDIMAALRSDFCISKGEGLFSHPKYCDLYIQCTAQAVAITMECSAGLIFNERKRECDYPTDDSTGFSSCPLSKQLLRPLPKAEGTLIFNGNDVTGKFPTKFKCDRKAKDIMLEDDDWCNIYHVCGDRRDNIFICPPGTIFNKKKQGCNDRYSAEVCHSSKYYKPNFKRRLTSLKTSF